MARTRALLVVAAAVLLALSACAAEPTGPEPVTLAELAAQQEQHDGTFVVTEGIVRTYDTPPHYWIEDVDLNRVELVPMKDVEGLVGHEIRVVGRFSFQDDRGRVITVDDLEVLRERPAA